jgi:hypothetical protein
MKIAPPSFDVEALRRGPKQLQRADHAGLLRCPVIFDGTGREVTGQRRVIAVVLGQTGEQRLHAGLAVFQPDHLLAELRAAGRDVIVAGRIAQVDAGDETFCIQRYAGFADEFPGGISGRGAMTDALTGALSRTPSRTPCSSCVVCGRAQTRALASAKNSRGLGHARRSRPWMFPGLVEMLAASRFPLPNGAIANWSLA